MTWWNRLRWALGYFLVATADYNLSRRLNFAEDDQLRAAASRAPKAQSFQPQNRWQGGMLTHSKPRSIRSKWGAMKSRTLGEN